MVVFSFPLHLGFSPASLSRLVAVEFLHHSLIHTILHPYIQYESTSEHLMPDPR